MSTCFNDHMLLCSHAFIFTCFYFHLFRWLYAPMFKCFYNHMPTYVNALMIAYLNALIFACLISIHMHTRGSWNVYRLGGINDHVVGLTCAQMLWWLCLNAGEIGRLEVCVLRFFSAHRLVCSHDVMLKCEHLN